MLCYVATRVLYFSGDVHDIDRYCMVIWIGRLLAAKQLHLEQAGSKKNLAQGQLVVNGRSLLTLSSHQAGVLLEFLSDLWHNYCLLLILYPVRNLF